MCLSLNSPFLSRNQIRRSNQLQSFFLILKIDSSSKNLLNFKKRTRPWVWVCDVTFSMPYQLFSTLHLLLISAYWPIFEQKKLQNDAELQMCMCYMFLWVCFVYEKKKMKKEGKKRMICKLFTVSSIPSSLPP